MELDELKQHWDNALTTSKVTQAVDYTRLKQQIDGPVNRLKRKFRNRMLLIPVICFAYTIEVFQMHAHAADGKLYLWFLAPLCAVTFFYFYMSYRILVQLEQQMDKPVMVTLQKQLQLLEKLTRWRLHVLRWFLAAFIIILEAVFYFSKEKQHLPAWSHQSLPLRLAAYISFFIFYYFFSKYLVQYHYMRPVQHLKTILAQTKE